MRSLAASLLATILLASLACCGEPSQATGESGARRDLASKPRPDGGAAASELGPLGAEARTEGGAHLPACGAPGATLQQAATLALPGRVLGLGWSPDGARIAVSGRFRAPKPSPRYDLKIFEASSGTLIKQIGCPVFWTSALAWSQNPFLGDVVAAGNYGHTTFLWNASGPGTTSCDGLPHFVKAEGALQALGEIDGAVTWLAFSPDGRWLAAANRDPSVRLWQLHADAGAQNQHKVVSYWSESLSENFTSVGWSPDGRRLVATERKPPGGGRVMVWSFDPKTDLWDQSTIDAFAKLDGTAQESWAAQPQNLPRTRRSALWSESGHEFWRAAFSPDGTRVGAASADGLLSIYDAGDGSVLHRWQTPTKAGLAALDWSPDGRLLAVGGADHQVHLIEASTGSLVQSLAGHTAQLTALAWSPDGCALVSAAGGPRICGGDCQTAPGSCHCCDGVGALCDQQAEWVDLAARVWRWSKP